MEVGSKKGGRVRGEGSGDNQPRRVEPPLRRDLNSNGRRHDRSDIEIDSTTDDGGEGEHARRAEPTEPASTAWLRAWTLTSGATESSRSTKI